MVTVAAARQLAQAAAAVELFWVGFQLLQLAQ
jgi:hypothetical protein